MTTMRNAPTCRGSLALGSGCGHCERCHNERAAMHVAAVRRLGALPSDKVLRRERIATAALQGYLASFAGVNQTYVTAEQVAVEAVTFADALIAELAKEPQR